MYYRYKDLETAQAEGKGLSFLPLPVAVPNAPLLRNGRSDRDRNRMVAPLIMSEAFFDAGHPSKKSHSSWTKMLDILYTVRLCIHDWPAGVPPPGRDFDLKTLSASQLRALVGPYPRKELGNIYLEDLGRDEDEYDAEKATTTKQKGKSRARGTVVEEPDISLSIKDWSPHLTRHCGEVNLIPLVIATDGVILRRLKDSEKFIKELPPHVAHKQLVRTIHEESPNSDAGAEHLNTGTSRPMGASRSHPGPSGSHQEASRLHPAAPCSDYWASRSNSGAPRSQHGASRSNPPVPMHTNYDELLDYRVHPDECDDLPPSSPPPSSPYVTPQGLNAAAGRYQYNCLREDIRHSMGSQLATQKRTRDDYETAREAEDIETGIVDERYRSRIHDRANMDIRSTLGHNPKPYVRTPSKAHMGPAPNQNTTCLPSRSSIMPYSEGSPSPRQYDSHVRSAHVRPVDHRLLAPVDE
ncbi:hypothetical protein K503DRAFT_805348 [Rhizopogon vinicolor AM-OR11-026]|uniref:Uncharacterized protein n=1 Tax=Rhizopogon vinicolor AM-OR11-026 TaxID=1314800 RepID=A0A1B7MI76_9AGAM|nr:hypothetical protein K503DRAFT_805348 [Rhizopogon vinicolor AM-OR11-026]